MKTSLFALFLMGCAHAVEGSGEPAAGDAEPSPSGETLAEGTTSPPETAGGTKPAPTTPAPTTTPAATKPPPAPAPTTTATAPTPAPLEYGQTLLDRWCTQVTQCATQGYPGYGPVAACEWQLTLQGKWSCQESEWSACATAISETNCGSNLPTICTPCTGGQGAKLP